MRLKLGFSGDAFGYCITMGLPAPSIETAFSLDPEIKRECIWSGPVCKPDRILADRSGPSVKIRTDAGWRVHTEGLSLFESIFLQIADPNTAPEVLLLRETIRGWRFYDQLRTDPEAPSRIPQLGTRTPVLSHDGKDLAAAIQTIIELGDPDEVADAVNEAFPGATLEIARQSDGRFGIELRQHGLLRPLTGAELSDGTLRYLLWLAALLTPSTGDDGVERTRNEPASRPPPCPCESNHQSFRQITSLGGHAFPGPCGIVNERFRRPFDRTGKRARSNPSEGSNPP